MFLFRELIIVYFRHTRILEGCIITSLEKIHLTLRVVPLLRYHKYTRLLGGFIFFGFAYIFSGSVELFSSAQWIYFLRLSEIIFFGSVDSSSSAYWIYLLRIHLIRLSLVSSNTILPDAFLGQWIYNL